jgi:hypothetical protein
VAQGERQHLFTKDSKAGVSEERPRPCNLKIRSRDFLNPEIASRLSNVEFLLEQFRLSRESL